MTLGGRARIRRGVVCVIAAAATITMPAAGAAQREQAASLPLPGWLPREVRPIDGITASQRVAAMATLEKIERILQQVPELARPDGFEILPVILGGARQHGPGQKTMPGSVVEYILTLVIYAPTRAAGGGCGCISVRVNPTVSGRMYDAQGRDIYIEAERGKPSSRPEISDVRVPHATQVYGELWNVPRERSFVDVLFVTAGELPWRQVTREEFYQASLLELEGANGERQADVSASFAKTRYQEWSEGATERRKTREQVLIEAAKFQTPAEVEKLRQTLETTEREVTDQLKKSEADDRERNQNALVALHGPGDSMRAELERMSPTERAMPAYINNALSEGPIATGWRLTSDPAPPAWRVLMPNYDFWRARSSPVEVRSINVHIGVGGTGLRPNVHRALWQTFQQLDWGAINALLETPR
jgi:hypothetical protein